MNLTDKGMQLKKGSRPSEKAAGKVLKTQEKDAKERCPDCGNIYRIELLKEGEDWNDFGYRHCPFCGLFIDLYAR